MFASLLLLLLAQATAAPAASAKGDVLTLFTADDYPVEAQRANLQGDVRARLSVGEDGRPKACTIVNSSGHAVLDTATCDILLARARFNPARDGQGRPVAEEITTPPIRWRLQDDPRTTSLRGLFTSGDYPEAAALLGHEGTVQARIDVGTDGRPTNCTPVRSSGYDTLDLATCSVLMKRARFTPARDPAGSPIADQVTSPPISWRIDGNEVPVEPWSSRLMLAFDRHDKLSMCSVQFGGALRKRQNYVVDCSRLAGAADVPEALARRYAGRRPVFIFDWQFVPRRVNSINTPKDLTRYPLVNREVARFDIGADGRVTSCTRTGSEGEIQPTKEICLLTSGQRFRPEGTRGRGTVSATSTRATYVFVR